MRICKKYITTNLLKNKEYYSYKVIETKTNGKHIKTHVDLLHVWWCCLHKIRSNPWCARNTVSRQCLTIMTTILCKSCSREHMSRSNSILTNATRVVINSHILEENKKNIKKRKKKEVTYIISIQKCISLMIK